MLRFAATSNLCESFEDAYHAGPVLRDENSSLLFDLFVVNASGKHGRHNHANDG